MTASENPQAAEFDPGSFRDRSGRVFYRDGGVYRTLDEQAACEWRHAEQTHFVRAFMQQGRIIRTQCATERPPEEDCSAWRMVLEHQRVPFVSYPYEWSFSMLRDAARLHLDLLQAALDENSILKDATPFNVQFVNANPVFIDIPSIVRLNPGDVWPGYRQFCQLLLYPLMLQSYRGIDFQPALRGRLDGIEPETMLRHLSLRDRVRRGVFSHVYLHARLQQRFGQSAGDTRSQLKSHGFGTELIRANIRALRCIVEGMSWRNKASRWSEYNSVCPHVQVDAAAKETFVRDVASARHWSLAWDLGCNTGRYARIVAEHADCVVAMDGDHRTIETLYLALQREQTGRILPLIVDLADPSPGRGWRGRERLDLVARGRPQLTLCLAVLHHLVIGRNLPLTDVIDWLAELGTEVVLEFVSRNDAQVQALLRNRPDQHADYTLERCRQLLSARFDVCRSEPLPSGTRTLLHARPRVTQNGR